MKTLEGSLRLRTPEFKLLLYLKKSLLPEKAESDTCSDKYSTKRLSVAPVSHKIR